MTVRTVNVISMLCAVLYHVTGNSSYIKICYTLILHYCGKNLSLQGRRRTLQKSLPSMCNMDQTTQSLQFIKNKILINSTPVFSQHNTSDNLQKKNQLLTFNKESGL